MIYWAVLVLVGFICVWQQAEYGESDLNTEYPDLSKVMCAPGTNASMLMSPNGTFHRRALDKDFIQNNGCTDPCNLVDVPSIFRNQNDLVLLTHSEALLWNYTLPGEKYQKAERFLVNENKVLNLDWWSLPFIVVQGVIAALFGRRDPREIRDLIYINLFMEHTVSHKPAWVRTQEGIVRAFAGLNYLIAVAVVIFCPVLFIITLISQEFQIWTHFPDSERPYSVGQWTPWVSTTLVILAALIARYHDRMIELICEFYRRVFYSATGSFSSRYKVQRSEPEHGTAEAADKREMVPGTEFKADLMMTSTEDIGPRKSVFSLSRSSSHAPKLGFKTLVKNFIPQVVKACSRPLNQNDNGLSNEIVNFIHWCKDPQAVSRHVIRHPIRPHEAEHVGLSAEATEAANQRVHCRDESGGFFWGASVERRRGDT